MPSAMKGIVQSAASASRQSLTSMITSTPMIVSVFGIMLVTAFASTSFKEFTSPMILARIFPVGLLSKKVKESS